jgi:hypothetical protein
MRRTPCKINRRTRREFGDHHDRSPLPTALALALLHRMTLHELRVVSSSFSHSLNPSHSIAHGIKLLLQPVELAAVTVCEVLFVTDTSNFNAPIPCVVSS